MLFTGININSDEVNNAPSYKIKNLSTLDNLNKSKPHLYKEILCTRFK